MQKTKNHEVSELNYTAAINYISERLKGLRDNLYYHNLDHTLDVANAASWLANIEGVEGEDKLLLLTAAYYHESGFLIQYENNQEIAVNLVKGVLPAYGYSDRHIKTVTNLILATKMPQTPKNKHLEQIICDADNDNLGRGDFFQKTENLRRELASYVKIFSPRQWYEKALEFLEWHNYFTETSKKFRQSGKEKNIREIKELLGR